MRSTCSTPKAMCRAGTPGGERIKGYTPAEIIGQHFSRFYTDADQAAGRPARALSIAREAGRYEEEGWRVRKDGSFFWASVVIDPIRDDDGKLIGFAKITRDITERRNAQDGARKGPEAARRVAEDGCARPAHRRRGARLQQPSHGRGRQHPGAEEGRRAGSQGGARRAGDRACGPARRHPDPPVADVFTAPARQSASDRCASADRVDPRSLDQRIGRQRPAGHRYRP